MSRVGKKATCCGEKVENWRKNKMHDHPWVCASARDPKESCNPRRRFRASRSLSVSECKGPYPFSIRERGWLGCEPRRVIAIFLKLVATELHNANLTRQETLGPWVQFAPAHALHQNGNLRPSSLAVVRKTILKKRRATLYQASSIAEIGLHYRFTIYTFD